MSSSDCCGIRLLVTLSMRLRCERLRTIRIDARPLMLDCVWTSGHCHQSARSLWAELNPGPFIVRDDKDHLRVVTRLQSGRIGRRSGSSVVDRSAPFPCAAAVVLQYRPTETIGGTPSPSLSRLAVCRIRPSGASSGNLEAHCPPYVLSRNQGSELVIPPPKPRVGGPSGARTQDLRIKSPLLCQTELRAHASLRAARADRTPQNGILVLVTETSR